MDRSVTVTKGVTDEFGLKASDGTKVNRVTDQIPNYGVEKNQEPVGQLHGCMQPEGSKDPLRTEPDETEKTLASVGLAEGNGARPIPTPAASIEIEEIKL